MPSKVREIGTEVSSVSGPDGAYHASIWRITGPRCDWYRYEIRQSCACGTLINGLYTLEEARRVLQVAVDTMHASHVPSRPMFELVNA